jgi:hypothetical protein
VAGRTVFEEMDHVHLRTYDPKFIEAASGVNRLSRDPIVVLGYSAEASSGDFTSVAVRPALRLR